MIFKFVKWLKPHLTPGTVVLILMLTVGLGALVYSEWRAGVNPAMLSPLVAGRAPFFTPAWSSEYPGTLQVTSGSNKMEHRRGSATWHYHWQVTGEKPVTDDVVLDELFRLPGVTVEDFLERGPAGGTVRARYSTAADGHGIVTWTVRGKGPWEVDMTVQESLRNDPLEMP